VTPQAIEAAFPVLSRHGYRITSRPSGQYNCYAWAARDVLRWWEPHPAYFWPPGVPQTPTLAAFMQAYASVGFVPCLDGALDAHCEKIAIYIDRFGRPKHAARQLRFGKWTSKLGREDDITHHLDGLTGRVYGQVAQFMKRPRTHPVDRLVALLGTWWYRWTGALASLSQCSHAHAAVQ